MPIRIAFLLMASVVACAAGDVAPTPLTDTQKLQIRELQIQVQQFQIHEMQAEEQLTSFLDGVTPAGYKLDSRLNFVKK